MKDLPPPERRRSLYGSYGSLLLKSDGPNLHTAALGHLGSSI